MSYAAFRQYVAEIDQAIDAIKRAQDIPNERARCQGFVELKTYYDGYYKPTKEMLAAAQSALKQLVEDARKAGEAERDAIVAKQVAIIESRRAYLSQAVGTAIIDLGVIARGAA